MEFPLDTHTDWRRKEHRVQCTLNTEIADASSSAPSDPWVAHLYIVGARAMPTKKKASVLDRYTPPTDIPLSEHLRVLARPKHRYGECAASPPR